MQFRAAPSRPFDLFVRLILSVRPPALLSRPFVLSRADERPAPRSASVWASLLSVRPSRPSDQSGRSSLHRCEAESACWETFKRLIFEIQFQIRSN